MAAASKVRKLSLAAVVAVACVALTGAGTAGALGRYTDAAGDGKGAADLTGVSVSSDQNGQITFMVGAASALADGDGWFMLALDTDQSVATGALPLLGAEYVFGVDAEGYSFGRWTGSDWDWETPYSTVRLAVLGSNAIVSINSSELGGTRALNFWARSARGDPESGVIDDAPDDGTFNYSLAAGGPDIREVAVQTTPAAGPRAGRRFVVRPIGLMLPEGLPGVAIRPQPDAYRCAARLGAKALRGSGVGGCTFSVPKNAKRKRLVVTLTVQYQGASKAVSLAYVVR
jgi:hypothetical protein